LSWTIKVSSKAESYIQRLDQRLRKRIKAELTALADLENPLSHGNVKPLTGELKGFSRLRIGHYRIIFALIKEVNTIAVVNIAPRGDVYS
jgi:mRNA interferase RelE/StbE